MPGNFRMDMKYYLDPNTGGIAEAVATDEGWTFPLITNEDQNLQVLEDDDSRVADYLRAQYGFDPRLSSQDFRYAGGGERVEINNAGTWEAGVQTQSGDRLPESQAQAAGEAYKPLPGYESGDSGFFNDIVNFVKDGWNEGALKILAMPFTAGLGQALSSTLGTANWVGNAIVGAGKSLLSGDNPLTGAVMGGASGALGGGSEFAAAEAADDMASGAAILADSGQSYEQFLDSLVTTGSAFDGMAASVGGPTTDAGKMLLADSGTGTMTDAPVYDTLAENVGGVSTKASDWLATQEADDLASGVNMGEPIAPGETSGGLISRALNWAKGNEKLAVGGTMAGAGLIAGAMNSSAADERLEKTIAANKELTSQRTQEQIALDASRRDAVQKGSYFDAKVPVKAKPGILRRPDGTPVYDNRGLISRAMGA